ncbi:MAG: site-specific DNA-methyltransferase [Desulfovibrionaceae bacterium]|nr:site-specific DNA-methyltransferase [Desulfovibrionaceae bacterium]
MMTLNTIYHGDARSILPQIMAESIDHVISDIPYGISHTSWDVMHNNTNSALLGASPAQNKAGAIFKTRGKPLNGWSEADKKIPLEYYEWCRTWTCSLYTLTKPGSSILIFAGRRLAHRAICAFEDTGFIFKDMLAWHKEKAIYRAQHLSKVYERRKDLKNAQKWDGWKIGNLRPLFEPILWFMKPYKIGGTLADNIINYGLGAYNENIIEKYGQTASNDLYFESKKEDTGLHPTQKPLQLIKYLIELVSQKKQIILDPFAGSGTTLLACKQLERNYIGIEQDKNFFSLAQKRLA